MKLNYSGQEKVEAAPAAVWAYVQDPERVAQSLPDVQDVIVHDQNNIEATVPIGVGFIRGKFKFKIEVQPDQEKNHINVKVLGGGLGNVLDLIAGADIIDNGDGTTTLDWTGEADIRGSLANVGGRMLDVQAQKLIAQTFKNLGTQVAAASKVVASPSS